jgi:hypothetical protein
MGEWGLGHAPESFALGWTTDDRAVIDLPSGACGIGSGRPGVYLFSSPGRATLAHRHGPNALVRMWGSA